MPWNLSVESSGQVSRTPEPRRPGRRPVAAQYAPLVRQWLREDPDLSGVEILRRIRVTGYRGGKSALYELVKRLRAEMSE